MEHNNRVTVSLIALVIAVAVFTSFGLPLFAGPTATIVLPTPVPTGSKTPGEERERSVPVEVKPATVQNVIAVMDRLESYSRVITTTLEGVSSTAHVWVDGGWTRADMELQDGFTIHTIVGEGRLWRWYNKEKTARSWAADGASVDIEGQRIPTYEAVLKMDMDAITAAGYEEKNGEACVYVEVAVPELAQTERYWVSEKTGLLWAAETVAEGEVVWSMTVGTTEVPVSPSASFALPDGTVLHTVGESTAALQEP